MNTLFCPDSAPTFLGLFDPSIAPALLYYTYIPVVLVSLSIGFFVLFKDRFSLVSKLLFAVAITFTAWVINIYFAWIAAYHAHVMFVWVMTPIIEVLLFLFSVYFVHVFTDEKRTDTSFAAKVILLVLGLPIILLLPTAYNIEYFNSAICEGVPGMLWNYLYLFETVLILWVGTVGYVRYRQSVDVKRKRQILYIAIGMISFLLLFLGSNVVGQHTGIQEISFIGSLGMVAFLMFLAYLIVRYQAFNVKLLGAQALVLTLIVLVGSQFFFVKTLISEILTIVTFTLVSIFGWILMRSVKLEVRRKEELQEIATKLAVANEELRRLDNTKSEFISIASHQLRTPLTAIKGFLSLVLEGSYGKLSADVEDVLNKVYSANNHLVDLVENLLNISRIESGRIQYQFAPMDIAGIVHELADAFSVVAKGRRLNLAFVYPETPVPPFLMDSQKIREVISNMIDNAIKYTQQGGVTVRLSSDGEKVRIAVSDTGVGIAPEDLPILFQKFRRGKESGKVNVSGTGLGLYVGKSFAEAHGGRMIIESEGVGKGSTFTLELPFRTENGLGTPESKKS